MSKLSNSEFVTAVSAISQVESATVTKVIDGATDVIQSAMKEGNSVTFGKLGTFGARHIEERKGRNPQSGEELTVKAHDRPFFKPSKTLKEAIN